MKQVQKRAEQLARAEQRRAIARIAAALHDQARGIAVEASGHGVVLRGRGLIRRWLVDPGLRFVAGARR